MKSNSSRLTIAFGILAIQLSPVALAAAASAPQADVLPREKRQAVLDLAARLSHPIEPAPVPADLKSPFAFDSPDPMDVTATGGQPAPGGNKTARDILEILAANIKPSGAIIGPRGPVITLGRGGLYKVGDKFTVTYDGKDYELELTAIDRTSFSLKYQNEVTTRPIK